MYYLGGFERYKQARALHKLASMVVLWVVWKERILDMDQKVS